MIDRMPEIRTFSAGGLVTGFASFRIECVMMLPTDDPLSSRHAEPAQEPLRSARRTRTRR